MVVTNRLNTEQPPLWLLPTVALKRFQSLENKPIEIENTNAENFFGFKISGLAFLITANTYCEVIEHLPVNPLPNVDAWFSGLLNLRGNLVPVIDLQILFAQPPTNNKRQLLVIDRGEKAMAIWIDGLPELHSVRSQALKQLPPLPQLLERCVMSGHLHTGQVWLNVQFDTLFKALGDSYAN